jgi:hypothetical protein
VNTKSVNLDKAYQYLKLSGEKTAGNCANWEAFTFYNEAINTLSQLADTWDNKREQIQIRILIHTPMRLLSYPEGSLKILEDGVRLSKEVGAEKNLAILYTRWQRPAGGR